MHQNLGLLMLLCSLHGTAQFYVTKNTSLSLESSQSVLSSQEHINQIDASVFGDGTLYFNSTLVQGLTSTQELLALPNIQIQNASLVHIKTALNIQNQLHIETGVLMLSEDIVLYSKAALVLGTKAFITTTTDGQLVYTTQFESSSSLAVVPTLSLLKYRRPEWSQGLTQMIFIYTPHAHNFGVLAYNGYTVYLKTHLPPPEFLNTIS